VRIAEHWSYTDQIGAMRRLGSARLDEIDVSFVDRCEAAARHQCS
jgi:hypothetical protein